MKQQLNILQVDNSVAINLYRKIMLLSVPAIKKIEVANSILQAKRKIKNQAFDFMILDSFLPDGNGIDFSNWIKKKYPSLIIILFTNDSDQCFEKAAQQSGADYFLDKSTGFEILVQIIKNKNTSIKNPGYANSQHTIC